MAGITVVYDRTEIRSLLTSPQGPVWRDIQRRSRNVQNLARRKAPADTGTLKRSIITSMEERDGFPVGVVSSNLEYALYVHEGTGIYGPRGQVIRPRTAKVLRWPQINNNYKQTGGPRRYKGGRTAAYSYARFVRGVRPRPFLRDALEAAALN